VRLDSAIFVRTVAQEFDAGDQSGTVFTRLNRHFETFTDKLAHLRSGADDRYDRANHERKIALAALIGLTILSLAVFERRGRVARRQRADALRRENDRLVELDTMKEEFVASVSHELRTPLTSIRGYVELLLDGEGGPTSDDQNDFLRVIDRNTDRLLSLINDLLAVTRAEAGGLVLTYERNDLGNLVRDAISGAKPAAAARSIDLRVVAEPLPEVSVDPTRIGQVLDNLLSNALKFTPVGGTVEVRLVALNGEVQLEIADNGVGIPAAEQARLFERFFRTAEARGSGIQGTGLGLAISKTIVEAHHGSISVASTPGVGTTFSVILPAAA
jgi:signal transduction histidine kinase